MRNIFNFAKRTIKDVNARDRKNMPVLYNSFSIEEKNYIDEFMRKCNKYKKNIIFNEKSDCINFCYKNMQIGRIRLNNKKRKMQILTTHNSFWIEDITLK
jgi:hypothetical protein